MHYETVKLLDLKSADQIAVSGNVKDLSPILVPFTIHTDSIYFHHGIFDKETLAVYDVSGDSKENARPRKRDFTEFYSGHTQLYRVVYDHGEQCLPADEVLKRAKYAVDNPSSWPYYDIIRNNCESFATFLKTGCKKSEQAIKAVEETCKKAAISVGAVVSVMVCGSSPVSGSVTAGSPAVVGFIAACKPCYYNKD